MNRRPARKPAPSQYLPLTNFGDGKLEEMAERLRKGGSIEGVANSYRVCPDDLRKWWGKQA